LKKFYRLTSQYRKDISSSYQRIKDGSRTVETSRGLIQYAEFGEGPPILLVHGAGGGYDQGIYFAKLIGGYYRWIAPSRFGFLGTPVPEFANSRVQAEAFDSLLDALDIDRVGVVGVSMGGPSSLEFARHYPHRIKSLSLISAASHEIEPRPILTAIIFKLFLNDFIYWTIAKLNPSMLLQSLGVPEDVQKQLSQEEIEQLHSFLEAMLPMNARRKGQLLEQQMSEIVLEDIKEIQTPTLVIHAVDDMLIPIEHGKFTARVIEGARFITMEKGGHLALILKQNSSARESLRKFLSQFNPQIGV